MTTTTNTTPVPADDAKPVALATLRPTSTAGRAAFAALFWRDLTVLRKEFAMFLARTIMQPLLLLFVFTYVFPKIGQGIGGGSSGAGGRAFNDIIIGGVLASSIIFQGIQAVALPMVQDFGFTREIEDRVLAPLPVEALALQKVLAGAVQALLAALVIFPLALVVPAAPIDLSIRPLYLCTLLPLGCVFSASLGLALGTRVQPKYVSLIFTLLLLPMTFLGCVYYPWRSLSALPVLKWAVVVNPLVYLAEGMRLSLSDRVPHMPALVIVVVMVVATAGLVKLGVDGFKRRVLT